MLRDDFSERINRVIRGFAVYVGKVTLRKRPTCCYSTKPHSNFVSPAVTLTNSAPLCTQCTGFIGFSATKPIFPFNNITTVLQMRAKKVFCADGTEFICITLTDLSLQPVTTETGFDSRIVQVIFEVITVKLRQGFFLVFPLCFQYRIIDIS